MALTDYIFVGYDDSCHLFVTDDGGASWIESVVPPDSGWESGTMAIVDLDYETFFTIDNGTSISNYGKTTITQALTDPPIGVGWAIGTVSHALGNIQWASMSTAANIIISNVENASDGSQILVSRDGGSTWGAESTGVNFVNFGFSCMSANAGYIYLIPEASVTRDILVSTDKGVSYSPLLGSPKNILRTFNTGGGAFCSADGSTIVIMEGEDGTRILTSRDYGVSWTTKNISDFGAGGQIVSGGVAMTPDGTKIIFGFYSFFHNQIFVGMSTDSGLSWSLLSPPSAIIAYGGPTIVGISPDGQALSVFYANGVVVSRVDLSADGGATWSPFSFDLTNKPEGIPGYFVAAYILPKPPPPPPTPTVERHRQIRDPWDCDEWGRFQPGVCIRKLY